jgi:hypothetical protein
MFAVSEPRVTWMFAVSEPRVMWMFAVSEPRVTWMFAVPVENYEDIENVVLKRLTLNCTGKNDSNFLTDEGYEDCKGHVRLALLTGTIIRPLYTYQKELITGDRISCTLQQRLCVIWEVKPSNCFARGGTQRQIKVGWLTQHNCRHSRLVQ